MRSVVVAALASLVLAACVPSRENPQDPAIAPQAILSLVNIGPGELCPDDVAPQPLHAEYDTATDVSRGRCLALDGRGSDDPQGKSDLKKWRFTLPAALDFPERTVTSTSGFLVLEKDYRSALPANGDDIVFKVRVSDRDGNYGKAKAIVKFRNATPIAEIRSGASVTPGGVPWAPGTKFHVILDGSASNDADGDDLRYCWSAPGVAESCVPGPEGESFGYDVPLEAGRYVVSLRIKDAKEGETETLNSKVSRTAKANVWVESPVMWETETSSNSQRMRRIDTSAFSSITAGAFLATSTPRVISEVDVPSPRLRSFSFPDGNLIDELVYASARPDGALFMDSARSRFWVLRSTDSNGGVQADLFSVDDAGAFTDHGSATSTIVAGFRGRTEEVGPDGTFWVGSMVDGSLASFSSDPPVAILEAVDASVLDLSGRPGTSEMWALVQEPDTTGLRIFDGPGDAAPERVDIGQLTATAFEWIDGTELWISSYELGLTRLDMDVLRQSLDDGISPETSFLLATTANIDDVDAQLSLLIDPESSEIWTTTNRIAANESVHHSEGTPLFIDPQGYTWKSPSSGTMRRARSLDLSRVMEDIEVPGAFSPSVDVTRGSLWVVTSDPPMIEEITSEGDVGRRIPVLNFGGTPQLIPAYDVVAVAANGQTAFAADYISGDSIVDRIDLTQSPPAATRVLTYDDVTDDKYVNFFNGFTASVDSPEPFVWAVEYDATEMYPVRISQANGSVRDTGVTIPSQFGDTMTIARSVVDDGVCIATMVSTYNGTGSNYTLTLRLYRAVPGSPAVQLDFRQFAYVGGAGGGSYYTLPFVAATRSPTGGEMCWTGHIRSTNPATNEVLTVFGATQAGTVRSFTYTGATGEDIRAVVPVSPDEVYYMRDETRYRRHSPNGSGVLSSEEVLFNSDSLGPNTSFVTAESKLF